MQNIHDYIDTLNITEGVDYRGDCPECGKRNTFTVSKSHGSIVYNCFSNSCSLGGGSLDYTPDLDTLRNKLLAVAGRGARMTSLPFELPPYLVRGIANERALEWLLEHNAYEAYKKGLYEIYTDPRENRIVVPLYDINSTLVNATGRYYGGGYPKIKGRVYSSNNIVPPFMVNRPSNNERKILVVVEDFASAAACTVQDNVGGMALLGTNFKPDVHIPHIKKVNPDKIVVALDKDATRKGLAIKKLLTFMFDNVTITRLHKDLKDMNTQELHQCLANMT